MGGARSDSALIRKEVQHVDEAHLQAGPEREGARKLHILTFINVGMYRRNTDSRCLGYSSTGISRRSTFLPPWGVTG